MKQNLRNAVRSLKREILDFRFDYPLQIVPEAASAGSLHYHLYSDALRWEAMRMGSDGVPRVWERATGEVYWPSYIAWYGLVRLGDYLRHGNEESLNAFLTQASWLEQNAVVRHDGAVVWPLNFDYTAGPVVLKPPWISAYVQGLVISALVRAFRLTKRPQFMELLRGATKVFQLTVANSGVCVLLDNHALYAELPGGRPPGILDGFMTALLGLYDLSVETGGDPAVRGLFEEGIAGLEYALPRWDYRKKWSWYGSRAYLSPPAYHHQHFLLLQVLARLSKQPVLSEYAEQWCPGRLSAFGRTEVYLGFLLTKNWNRLRRRTWKQ